MEHIDTHDVEIAFDDLMKELSKLKDLNNLVNAYKDNIDTLSSKIKGLTEQIESFYNNAKEHDTQVNVLYQRYVDKAEYISAELEKHNKDLTEQIETFYNSAKEHNAQLNALYKGYVDKAESISSKLEKRCLEIKQIGRRNTIFNVITLILGVFVCAGLVYLIYFA